MKILVILLTLLLSLTGCMQNPVGGAGSEGNFDSDFQPYNVLPRSFSITSLTPGDMNGTVVWSSSLNSDSYTIKYRAASTLTFTEIDNVTSPYTITGLTNAQTYLVKVTAKNQRGETDSQSLTVTPTDNIVIVPGTPVLSYASSAGTSIDFGNTMSVVPSLLNNNGAPITNCTSTPTLPSWATLNPNTCVISGTPTTPMSGTYTIRARNSAGLSAGAVVSLAVGAQVPSLSFLGATGTSGSIDEAMLVNPTLLNGNGSSITNCSSSPSLPAWATLNPTTCTISGTPDSTLTSSTYLITASNIIGDSIAATVTLEVDAKEPLLSYVAALGTMNFVGSAMTVTPTILQINGSPISNCEATPSLPTWATLNTATCVITGTPDAPLSPTTYSIVATNGIGASVGANVTLTAIAFNCPSGYVEVAANPSLNVGRFCVMQFEAKNNAGAATSEATGTPWTNISRTDAKIACTSLGNDDDLISNPEWIAIARDAELINTNWSSGTAGTGLLPRGHSDNNPTNGLAVSNTGNDYSDTLDTAGSAWEQKRNITLSTGAVVWDFSGNVSEWVDWRNTSGLQSGPINCSASSQEFSAVSCIGLSSNDYLPNNTFLDSTNGVGKFYGGSSGAVSRGGQWNDLDVSGLYSINLSLPGSASASVGFRCVNRPKAEDAPTLSFAGATGTTVLVGEPMSVLPTSLEANGAMITNCAVTPALPAWASLDPSNCEITGVPTGTLSATTYTITATNSVGDSNPANVTLAVNGAVPLLSYLGAFGNNGAVGIPMSVSPTLLNGKTLPIINCISSPALPAWATLNSTTCTISGTPNAFLMPTVFSITASNSAGDSTPANVTLSVSATAPVLSYSGATGLIGYVGSAMSVAPTTLVDNGAAITNCTASPALPAWASINPTTCVISGTPTGTLGATTYTITATNAVGSSSGNVTFRANPAVPVISYAASAGITINYGSNLSVSPSTLIANGASITNCTISPALPVWASISPSTCIISGTPTASHAATTYTVRASNSAGQSLPTTVTLTVNALPPVISYAGATGTTRPMNSAMSVSPTTLQTNGAPITSCTSSPSLPAWASLNPSTCVISGTPNAMMGATVFTITASNSAGPTSANVTLEVIAAAPTLSFAGATGTIGAIGTPMTVSPTSINNNGAAITNCTATPALPAWLSINPTTCVISGTPTATLSSTVYSIVATNSTGNSTPATVTLRSNVAVPTLSYVGATGTTINFGGVLSVTPTTLNNNGASITNCTITPSLPAWANINPTTCVISGTATSVVSGVTYSVRASNSAGLSVAAPVTLTVNPIPPSLSYVGSVGTNGAVGVAMSVVPTSLVANGAAVTSCTATPALPSWATLNSTTCRITGTPDAVLVATIFDIAATNIAGDSVPATVTLSVAASVPTLSYVGATGTIGTFGSPMSVAPTTLLDNGAVITQCDITPALPAWASINASTCDISGTPNAILASTAYSVRARNSAGFSSVASVTLRVNPAVPTISYAGATGTTVNFGSPMSVAPTTLSANGAAVTNCTASPALPAWATLNPATCIISGTPNSVITGVTYSISAINSVGSSVASDVTLTVNPIAPTISYAGATGTTGYVGLAMSVTPPTLNPNGAAISNCTVAPALPAWATLNSLTCVITGTPDATMSATTYAVTAHNSVGPSTSANVTLSVETVALPEISYSGSAGTTGAVGFMMTVTPTNLDENGSAISGCTISPALPSGLAISPTTCVISGTPTATMGATAYTVTVTNDLGDATDTVTLTINAGRPIISYSGSTGTTVNLNQAMSVTPTTLSNNQSTITDCVITPALPTGLSINTSTCIISGVPTAAIAATDFTVTAKNVIGDSDPVIVNLTVNPIVPTISFAGATGTTGAVGSPMSVSPTSLVENGALVTNCTITPALSAGLSINTSTCVISGTPTATRGATTYSVTAINSAGSSIPATVSLTVTAAVPVISYAGAVGTTGSVANAMTISPTTLNNNGSTITGCSSSPALPAGLAINSTTCVISGTPTVVVSGVTYTITATNTQGSSLGADVTLTINASVPTISYATSTGTTVNFGVPMSVTPSTINSNGQAITGCQATPALPAWATLNSTTCVITGTPTDKLPSTTYAIVASNLVGDSTAANVTLRVNAIAPTISYVGATGTSIAIGNPMSVSPTSINANGEPITTCTASPALPAWASIDPTTCVITGVPNATSSVTYTITASNIQGPSTATVTLSALANVPTLTYSPSTFTGTHSQALTTITPTLLANGAPVTTCISTPALPAGLSLSNTTCEISGAPIEIVTGANYTIVAHNSAGDSVGTVITFTVNPDRPVISYANTTGKIGEALTITPTLNTKGAPIEDCVVTPSLPAWASLDPLTCVVTGTPDAKLPPNLFTVTAENDAGFSDGVILQLEINGNVPVLSYAIGASGAVGVPMTINATLNDRGDTVTNCTSTPSLPAGLSINSNTCVISGTPTTAFVATIYNITAANTNGSSAAAPVTITVEASAPSLSYASSTGKDGVFGTPMNVVPVLNDNGANVSACDATPALPAWAAIDPNTCVISGTPNNKLDPTTYTIEVTNSEGSTTATVTLSVAPLEPNLSYATSTGNIVNFGVSMTVTPSTLEKNGADIIGCNTTPALPAGLSLNSTTCVISGVADAAFGPSAFSIIATNEAGDSTAAVVTLSVNALPPVVSYVGSTGNSGPAGTLMTITPTTLETNGASISACNVTPALPTGLTINSSTCVITGTPEDILDENFTITATNSAGPSAGAALHIEVTAAAPQLSYDNSPGFPGYVDSPMKGSPTLFRHNGATTVCSVTPAPTAPITFDTATCTFEGTPTATMASTSYLIRATNSEGYVEVNVSLEVKLCPTGYINIPEDTDLGTPRFCVMKYEARENSGKVSTNPLSYPWTEITIADAKAACRAQGYDKHFDLISNIEWMAIARNIETYAANWFTGTLTEVDNMLPIGHSSVIEPETEGIPYDKNILNIEDLDDPWDQTTGESTHEMNRGWEQKRTFTINNGATDDADKTIWDFSANVWEWVDWDRATGLQKSPMCVVEDELKEVDPLDNSVCKSDIFEDEYMPFNQNLVSDHGVGIFMGNEDASGGTTQANVVRGGDTATGFIYENNDAENGDIEEAPSAGIYTIGFEEDNNLTEEIIGFRCVFRPENFD